MDAFSLILLFNIFFYVCEAGVTEIPQNSEDEGTVETVSEEAWMPSNIFDVKMQTSDEIKINPNLKENEIQTEFPETEASWNDDSSPIFKAIRDFIFQASDEIIAAEERNDDPTEEIVRMLEKGLIEATTAFLNPSEQISTAASEAPQSEFSIVKIENVQPATMLDRIGASAVDLSSSREISSVVNTTTACSDCYNTLQTCVQMCFTKNNCNDVQRQARVCPQSPTRLCNIFTQWGPVDECQVNEDCESPLLCCSDGCVKKCSPGIWQN